MKNSTIATFALVALTMTAQATESVSRDTCSGDDKSSMMQTRIKLSHQLEQLELDMQGEADQAKAPKPAVTSPPCGFESSGAPYCQTWSNVKGDKFDWTRRSGSTPSSRTGPSSAHSGNHYLYIEASRKNGGDNAILQSSTTTFGTGAWLSFQYHMYGARIGTLKVVFKESGSSASPVVVWQKNAQQGHNWLAADIDLSPYVGKTGVIQLIGIILKRCANFLGDIAIDELSLTPGSPTATPTAAPMSASGTDVFDSIDLDRNGSINRDELKKGFDAGKITNLGIK